MNPQNILAPQDPRTALNFFPQFLPLCDLGDAPPTNPTKRNDMIRLQFLAVYYELNVAQAEFLAGRRGSDSEGPSGLEQKLVHLRQNRDLLEDQYAPYGIIAEPTWSE